MNQRKIKDKNIALLYVFCFFTLFIYSLAWLVSSKRDMNSIGGKIPTSWLAIIPFVNLYWVYKYSEAQAKYLRKDDNVLLWTCINLFVPFVTIYFVQKDLNKIAKYGYDYHQNEIDKKEEKVA